jgi:uncharacterized protein YihD (DUF1040 family)
MSIYLKLNKDINLEQLLQKLQQEINEHRKSNSLENSVLCINIKNITHVIEDIARETIKCMENNNDRENEMSK